MAPQPSFKVGLKIAREENRGVARSASTNNMWWQGGPWLDVTTDGLPALYDRVALIFPSGHAGVRAMNNRAPVQGRAHSDGTFSFPVTADFIGLLLYGALGSLSTQSARSTGNGSVLSNLVNHIPEGSTIGLVLSNQPSDGGAILRFNVTHTSAAGTISISGIDAYGNGASETISFASGGSFYTRTSFSAIGASSITVQSNNQASVTIDGFKYFVHTISVNNSSNPSFCIERLGDPTAGAASKSFMHTGMVVRSLTLNTPAAQDDGLFTGSVSLEGDPTVTCNSTSLNSTSPMKIWPAWGLKIVRNDSNWFKVTNQSMEVVAGNRNYKAAAGVQRPQGSFYGPQEATGSFTILVDDEAEYNRWRGASSQQIVKTWTTPHKLTSTQNQQLIASLMSTYLETVDTGEEDGALTLSGDFRTINSADANIARFELINGVPNSAYTG